MDVYGGFWKRLVEHIGYVSGIILLPMYGIDQGMLVRKEDSLF